MQETEDLEDGGLWKRGEVVVFDEFYDDVMVESSEGDKFLISPGQRGKVISCVCRRTRLARPPVGDPDMARNWLEWGTLIEMELLGGPGDGATITFPDSGNDWYADGFEETTLDE